MMMPRRHKETPISGILVMEKARLLYLQLYPGKSDDITA